MLRNRLFRQYLFSILGVCFAVLIFASFLTYESLRELVERRIHERAIEQLWQTRSVFDTLHATTIPAAVQLSTKRSVDRLMYAEDLAPIDRLRGMDELNSALHAIPIADSILVYNHLNDLVFSAYNGVFLASEFPDQELLDLIARARTHGTYRYIPRQIAGNNVFTVLVGDPPVTGEKLKGALVIQLSERALRSILSSGDVVKSGSMVIVDRNGTILSSDDGAMFARSMPEDPVIRRVLDNDHSTGSFKFTEQGRTRLVSFVTHETFGWRFYSVADYDALVGDLRRARNRTMLTLALLALASLAASVAASIKLYRPIGDILSVAASMQRDLLHEPAETALTQETMYLTEFLGHAREQLSLRERDREDELLAGLLRGTTRFDSLDIGDPVAEFCNESGGERAFVVVVRIDGLFDLFTTNGSLTTTWKAPYLERLRNAGPALMVTDAVATDDVTAVIRATDRSGSEYSAHDVLLLLDEVLGTAPEAMAEPEHSVTIAVSTPGSWPSGAHQMYWEARQGTNYRFRYGRGARIAYSAELDSPEEHTTEQLPDTEPLLNAVFAGQVGFVESRITTFIGSLRDTNYEVFRYSIQALLYRADRRLATCGRRMIEFRRQLQHLRDQTEWLESGDDVIRFLGPVFRRIAVQIHGKGEQKQNELVQSMVSRIDEHFTDPNLSAKSIADSCGISTNYARTLFKQSMDQSIGDRINIVRIEECTRRLSRDDVSVKTLYSDVGFRNYNYFFSVFKRITGMTPVQFKRRSSES